MRTYYEILGVSRSATLNEITAAKNSLAKVYHPDSNMQSGIDTTEQMQEILEAYRVLSNQEKRQTYDKELDNDTSRRVFRTFDIKKEAKDHEPSTSFVTYWNAATSLYAIVDKSAAMLEKESKRTSITIKVLQKLGKMEKTEKVLAERLGQLSMEALPYISLLKSAKIPMEYWQPEIMNWVLIRWGQTVTADFQPLFAQYEAYANQNKSAHERNKTKARSRQFHHDLKRLLSYALD